MLVLYSSRMHMHYIYIYIYNAYAYYELVASTSRTYLYYSLE